MQSSRFSSRRSTSGVYTALLGQGGVSPETVGSLLTVTALHRPWYSRLAWLLVALALAGALSSYVIITQTDQALEGRGRVVTVLLVANGLLFLGLGAAVGYRIWKMWTALRSGSVGSRLQSRVVMVFSAAVLFPTLIVSVFAALFFHQGITNWFDDRVGTVLDESIIVAEAYLDEHRETLRADSLAMSNDLRGEMDLSVLNPPLFQKIVSTQALLRSLTEAIVLQHGKVVARSRLSYSFTFEQLPENLLARARQGETVMLSEEDKILALIAIDPLSDSYLIVSRLVDPKVLQHLENAQGASGEYRNLRKRITSLQIRFSAAFILVALVMLFAVIWYGMSFVSRLVVPLSRLIKATEHIRAGDYSIRVETTAADGELATLIERFNRMTEQLANSRRELTEANRQIDERRRFTQAVLEGASAGVMALDTKGVITLSNRSANKLLHLDEFTQLQGKSIESVLPEITGLLNEARRNPKRLYQKEMVCSVGDGQTLTLHVRITTEMLGDKIDGYVVTYDDISALVSAQRRAAWADVARRIAHEIKNPLTPIQLSTERLRKKFLPTDPESQTAFRRYIDTISRHTSDIGTMVDEFVSFARMPLPVFATIDIKDLIDKAVFSAQTSFPQVHFTLSADKGMLQVHCDERQMGQVMTNVLKNAAEALERTQGKAKLEVDVQVRRNAEDMVEIIIEDNGVGFPPDLMDRIMEPYVTTREKGTGLGLAIVKKTLEDHGGTATIANREQGGARVTLTLPLLLEG